jgi:hypothetical protein
LGLEALDQCKVSTRDCKRQIDILAKKGRDKSLVTNKERNFRNHLVDFGWKFERTQHPLGIFSQAPISRDSFFQV